MTRAAAVTKAALASAKKSRCSSIETSPIVKMSVFHPATRPASAPKKPYPGMRSHGTQPGPKVSPSPWSRREPRYIP